MKPPLYSNSSGKLEVLNRPKSPELKTHLLKPALPRALIAIVILFQIILVVLFTRVRPESISTLPYLLRSQSDECSSGLVYVYDLPPMFNKDLLTDCNNLDPWSSKCDAVMNNGNGPRATTEFSRVVPEKLARNWYWTDHYMGEIIYHNRMLDYKCRTMEPESATAFYIPFYVGVAVGKFLWQNHTAKDRDWHCEMMLRWVRDQKWWKRSNGSDHFIMMGRLTWDFRRLSDSDTEWGSSFIYMQGMENVVRLTVEKNLWDHLEIAVPYPTMFHPRSVLDVREWQRFVQTHNRSSRFSFVGAMRNTIKNDFRGILLSQCLNESDSCRFVDCAKTRCVEGTTSILEAFLDSDFCLQPKGDGFTRRSVFDCMMAGSIPVFFWKQTAYEQYEREWFLPGEPESYSVFIDRNEVRNGVPVRRVLERYSREEVRRMREKVIEYIPKFLYGMPDGELRSRRYRDAFDNAIDGVLKKLKDRTGLRLSNSTGRNNGLVREPEPRI